METEIHAVADTTYLPWYTDPLQLAQAMHGLHVYEMFRYDDDGAEDEGVNDIDTTKISSNMPEWGLYIRRDNSFTGQVTHPNTTV